MYSLEYLMSNKVKSLWLVGWLNFTMSCISPLSKPWTWKDYVSETWIHITVLKTKFTALELLEKNNFKLRIFAELITGPPLTTFHIHKENIFVHRSIGHSNFPNKIHKHHAESIKIQYSCNRVSVNENK
jgi:hypothetical protein